MLKQALEKQAPLSNVFLPTHIQLDTHIKLGSGTRLDGAVVGVECSNTRLGILNETTKSRREKKKQDERLNRKIAI